MGYNYMSKCLAYCFGNRERKKREFAPLKSTIAPIEFKTAEIQTDESNLLYIAASNSVPNIRQEGRVSLKPIALFKNGNRILCHDPEDFSNIIIRNSTISPEILTKNISKSPVFKYQNLNEEGTKQDHDRELFKLSPRSPKKILKNVIKLPKLRFPVSTRIKDISNNT